MQTLEVDVVRSLLVHWRYYAVEHMVVSTVLSYLLHGEDVLGTLDDAYRAGVPALVRADGARICIRQVSADGTELHGLFRVPDRVR